VAHFSRSKDCKDVPPLFSCQEDAEAQVPPLWRAHLRTLELASTKG